MVAGSMVEASYNALAKEVDRVNAEFSRIKTAFEALEDSDVTTADGVSTSPRLTEYARSLEGLRDRHDTWDKHPNVRSLADQCQRSVNTVTRTLNNRLARQRQEELAEQQRLERKDAYAEQKAEAERLEALRAEGHLV